MMRCADRQDKEEARGGFARRLGTETGNWSWEVTNSARHQRGRGLVECDDLLMPHKGSGGSMITVRSATIRRSRSTPNCK